MSTEEVKIDGVSQFFWMAIPAILAVAGLLWLSFYIGVHAERRELSQEQRANQAVGAAVLPKAKISIVLKNKRGGCRIVDSAYLDGSDLWVYWHKVCVDNYAIPADSIRWSLLSPDGTVIGGGHDSAGEVGVGQRGEFHKSDIEADPRIATIEVSATWNDQ